MYSDITLNQLESRTDRIVKYGISEGALGYESFKVVVSTEENSVTIQQGVYITDINIVYLPSNYILSAFTTPTTDRVDYIYLDVTCDTDINTGNEPGNVIKYVEGGSIPTPTEGHTIVPIWEIHREANNPSITLDMIDDGNDPNSYDLRVIPNLLAPHTHMLNDGAVDVLATSSEINRALQGISDDVTADKLSDIMSTMATGDNLDELVSGNVTDLHTHDFSRMPMVFNTNNGDAIPDNSSIEFISAGGITITTDGNKITIKSEDDFFKNPAEVDLNMQGHRIYSVPSDDGTFSDTFVLNKKDIETKIEEAVDPLINHNATKTLNMNENELFGIRDLDSASLDSSAVNKKSLEEAINNSISPLEGDFDKRYKLGGTDSSNINSVSDGNIDMNGYLLTGTGTPTYSELPINDSRNYESTNKIYVDTKDKNILDESKSYTDSKIDTHELNSHPVNEDLDMAKSGSTKYIKGLATPPNDTAHKDYVVNVEFVQNYVAAYDENNPDDYEWSKHPAIQDVSLGDHKLVQLSDPSSGKDAANKDYVDNLISSLRNELNSLDLGFAKVGDFDSRKNQTTLPIDIDNGGKLDIRGTSGDKVLFVGKDSHNNDVVEVGTRIGGVEDPILDKDAVNKRYLDGLLNGSSNTTNIYPGTEYHIVYSFYDNNAYELPVYHKLSFTTLPDWIQLISPDIVENLDVKVKISPDAPDVILSVNVTFVHELNFDSLSLYGVSGYCMGYKHQTLGMFSSPKIRDDIAEASDNSPVRSGFTPLDAKLVFLKTSYLSTCGDLLLFPYIHGVYIGANFNVSRDVGIFTYNTFLKFAQFVGPLIYTIKVIG